jgi:putative glycosyltransferase (TIGR04372 family)
VVRLGDKTSSKLPPMTQVIDYANHPLKSDRLDLILCAKAKFILGNTSGISLLGTIFGTPCALANLIPISTLGFTKKDISIFKLLWLEEAGEYLSFDDAMSTKISNWQFSSIYIKNKILPEENTAEDIHHLTCEMFDLLSLDKISEYKNNINYVKAIKKQFKKNHYAYNSDSRIASFFIKKYENSIFK